MVKRRRLELPGNPKTAEEFENMIIQTRFLKVFRSMIILTDGFAAIFWSDPMFEYLKACDIINYDEHSSAQIVLPVVHHIHSGGSPCHTSHTCLDV